LYFGDSDTTSVEWKRGHFQAQVVVGPLTNFQITGTGYKGVEQDGKLFDGAAYSSWDGSGTIDVKNTSKFIIGSFGSLYVYGDSPAVRIAPEATFENRGVMELTTSDALDLSSDWGWAKNFGTIDVRLGSMKTCDFLQAGDVDIASGCSVLLGQTDLVAQPDQDPPTTKLDSTQAPGGVSAITGPGVAQFAAESRVTASGSSVSVNNVDDYSMSLSGTANLLVTGHYRWFGDPATGVGSWIVGVGGGGVQIGTATNTNALLEFLAPQHTMWRQLVNYGTMNWQVAILQVVPPPPQPPAPVQRTISMAGSAPSRIRAMRGSASSRGTRSHSN
jgi:hypothetical protein